MQGLISGIVLVVAFAALAIAAAVLVLRLWRGCSVELPPAADR